MNLHKPKTQNPSAHCLAGVVMMRAMTQTPCAFPVCADMRVAVQPCRNAMPVDKTARAYQNLRYVTAPSMNMSAVPDPIQYTVAKAVQTEAVSAEYITAVTPPAEAPSIATAIHITAPDPQPIALDPPAPKEMERLEEALYLENFDNISILPETIETYEYDEEEPEASGDDVYDTDRKIEEEPIENALGAGLLHYKKWWFLRDIDLSVNGELINGMPIFLHENTIRVINDAYSYFIPLHQVDYIRTHDGFKAACRWKGP